jgi:hypothetical protein
MLVECSGAAYVRLRHQLAITLTLAAEMNDSGPMLQKSAQHQISQPNRILKN